mmetsp:Transcript_48915/g.151615  ORF Transcript_48915/g.151615 Transcript_48915/m.151615 type:complete len:393 (-) Transcript_48915:508-1686(-)
MGIPNDVAPQDGVYLLKFSFARGREEGHLPRVHVEGVDVGHGYATRCQGGLAVPRPGPEQPWQPLLLRAGALCLCHHVPGSGAAEAAERRDRASECSLDLRGGQAHVDQSEAQLRQRKPPSRQRAKELARAHASGPRAGVEVRAEVAGEAEPAIFGGRRPSSLTRTLDHLRSHVHEHRRRPLVQRTARRLSKGHGQGPVPCEPRPAALRRRLRRVMLLAVVQDLPRRLQVGAYPHDELRPHNAQDRARELQAQALRPTVGVHHEGRQGCVARAQLQMGLEGRPHAPHVERRLHARGHAAGEVPRRALVAVLRGVRRLQQWPAHAVQRDEARRPQLGLAEVRLQIADLAGTIQQCVDKVPTATGLPDALVAHDQQHRWFLRRKPLARFGELLN